MLKCLAPKNLLLFLAVLTIHISAYGLESEETFQRRRRAPQYPAPDPILDLSGDIPSDKKVREAIVTAVQFLLDKQLPNGSWDENLAKYGMLGKTADEAVDATAFTALCGMGIRKHEALFPAGVVDKAVRNAAGYIMDRVIRGTLSDSVMYAIWRYSLGLQFLVSEFELVKKDKTEVEYRESLALVSSRMIRNIANMQFVSADQKAALKEARVSIGSVGKYAGPSNFGLICSYPSEKDYRGGALVKSVVPGSSAEEAGLKPGDRITKLNLLRIENAYDYYEIASEFVGGQRLSIEYYVANENGNGFLVPKSKKKKKVLNVTIKNNWPGYLGCLIDTSSGRVKVGKIIAGVLKEKGKRGLMEGDEIVEINKQPVNSYDDYKKMMNSLEVGVKLSLVVKRDGKEKKISSVFVVAVPRGMLRITPVYEDKSGRNGVKVAAVGPELKGKIKAGDRIVLFNNSPVLGLDHFMTLLSRLPQSRKVPVEVLRRNRTIKTEVVAITQEFTKTSSFTNRGSLKAVGSSLDVVWEKSENVTVKSVKRKGCSERVLREGDVVISVEYNGKKFTLKSVDHLNVILNNIPAGSELFLKVHRKGKPLDLTVQKTSRASSAGDVSDLAGGWSYYKIGEAFTFVTASVLISLIDAKKIIGNELSTSSTVIKKISAPALDMLEKMYIPIDKKHGIYAYRPGGLRGTNKKGLGAMGRTVACELAMIKGRKKGHQKANLKYTLEYWLKHREELDKVRLFKGTHHQKLYNNAAYYWLFGHRHAAMAANLAGGKIKTKVHDTILKAMMITRRKNGTWLGHQAFGEICGTARALMILGEIEGGFRKPEEATDSSKKKKYSR